MPQETGTEGAGRQTSTGAGEHRCWAGPVPRQRESDGGKRACVVRHMAAMAVTHPQQCPSEARRCPQDLLGAPFRVIGSALRGQTSTRGPH